MARRDVLNRLSQLPSDQQGQAMLEAALVIPMLLLFVFGVVTAGRVTHAKIAVLAAAREASRTMAASASEEAGIARAVEAARRAATGYGLSPERLGIAVGSDGFERGRRATAEVRYRVVLTDLPLFAGIEVTVEGGHAERIELYRSREGQPQ